MINLSYEEIKEFYLQNKYVFFTGNYNLNILGIRGRDRRVNFFDDRIIAVYQVGHEEKVFNIAGTVDPGLPFIKIPMEQKLGAAAIKEGQYRSVWQFGRFRGAKSLLQVREFTCYRDNNRDDVFDYIPDFTTKGLYGIHMHEHFQAEDVAQVVSNSSAGCVVPASRYLHYQFMWLCEQQIAAGYGNTFTFTLFDERNLRRDFSDKI